MSAPSRDPALSLLIATLDALSQRQARRALIARLQAYSRQCHLRIDAIAMNMDFPRYLEDFYRSEQIKLLAEQLNAQPFWWIGLAGQEPVMLYDSKRRLLWEAKADHDSLIALSDGKQRVKQLTTGDFVGWFLPRKEQLIAFATDPQNPLRYGDNDRLLGQDYWLCAGGRIDLDAAASTPVNAVSSGAVIACNTAFLETSPETFIKIAIQRGWTLKQCGLKAPNTTLSL